MPHAPATFILQTKLRRPQVGAGLLLRPRLLTLLDDVPNASLALITAPAGYGKTSLICQWLAQTQLPAAWLQIDEGDAEFTLFCQYLVHALRQLDPLFGPETEILLQGRHPPPLGVIANTLSNELDHLRCAGPFCLVIDDYHLGQSAGADRLLTQLALRPPHNFHLIVASRRPPTWSLGKLRVENRLLEVGEVQLRFTAEETAAYVASKADTAVDAAGTALLHKQTEGWATGLQLAVLALRQSHSAQTVLGHYAGFVGSNNQYLLDYMVDEVLAHLPRDLLAFMVSISLCTRFNLPLCQAVAGADRAQVNEYLRALEQGDMFLIPLSGSPHGETVHGLTVYHGWYRFHHLMQQTLRSRLHASLSSSLSGAAADGVVAELHRRAAAWLGELGYVDEALEHLAAVADWDTAAKLLQTHLDAVLNREDRSTLDRWLGSFPAAEISARPALLLLRAWIYFFNFDVEGIAQTLHQIQSMRSAADDTIGNFAGNSIGEPAGAMGVHLLLLQGIVHFFLGDPDAVIAVTRAALAQRAGVGTFVHASAYYYLATAMQLRGEGAEAETLVMEAYRREPHKPSQLSARLLFALGTVRLFRGRYAAAQETAELLLQETRTAHLALLEGWAHDMLARVAYERNDLPAAAGHFSAVMERCYAVHRGCAYDGFTGAMLVAAVQGRTEDVAAAAGAWRGFEQGLWGLPSSTYHSACARAALLAGESQAAVRWARSFSDKLSTQPQVWLESSHVTQIRGLLAGGSPADLSAAAALAETCSEHAARIHSVPLRIALSGLRALLFEAGGRRKTAVATLTEGLRLGAEAGFVRTFVDLGPHLDPLLAAVEDAALAPYVAQLRRAVAAMPARQTGRLAGDSAHTPARAAAMLRDNPLATLTPREAEVLALLASPMTLEEIGQQLFITHGTVRQHSLNIYAKLGVNKRRHAVLLAAGINPPQR